MPGICTQHRAAISVLFLPLLSHLLFSFFLSFLRLAHGFCCETCHLLSDIPAGLFDSMAANFRLDQGLRCFV
jgi:hypothetical protein